jgi:hypothetical protein
MSFGGGSSGGSSTQQVTPYAPAEPALAQILSEAGQLYGQGVGAAGYVPPTQQTLQGLAGQEALGTLAQQQMAATLGGQYLNPFLSPLIQNTAGNIYTNVAQQFSGAGRTPGSPMSQQQALSQVAQAALPLAFPRIWHRKRQTIRSCNSTSFSIPNRSTIRSYPKTTTTSSISSITTICKFCDTYCFWISNNCRITTSTS